MIEILIALIFGAVPNFMFGYGTSIAIKAKTPWPAVAFIVSGFISYSFALWLARRS